MTQIVHKYFDTGRSVAFSTDVEGTTRPDGSVSRCGVRLDFQDVKVPLRCHDIGNRVVAKINEVLALSPKEKTMIRPTVGRVVHYFPTIGEEIHPCVNGQPHAATIVYVHSPQLVNLSVVDANGKQYAVTSVPLFNPDDDVPFVGTARWMAFQTGQAQAADTPGGLMDRMAQAEAKLLKLEPLIE